MKSIGVLFACSVLLILLGGYLGALHPVGDSLAVIRIPVAFAGTLFLLICRRSNWFRVTAIFSALILALVFADRSRDTGPLGAITVYQKNLWFNNQNLKLIAEDIRAQSADIVMLQEVSTANRLLLDLLRPDYPYQHLCPIKGWSGVAVVSNLPAVDETKLCSDWRAFAAMQVRTEHGPVWAVSLHLFWPYPKMQSKQLGRILPKLTALKGPVILAGDLNMLPGTRVENQLETAIGSTALRPVYPTIIVRDIPLSIDQVMAKCGLVERRPKLGSDHFGLVAKVGFDDATC